MQEFCEFQFRSRRRFLKKLGIPVVNLDRSKLSPVLAGQLDDDPIIWRWTWRFITGLAELFSDRIGNEMIDGCVLPVGRNDHLGKFLTNERDFTSQLANTGVE